MNLEHGKVYFQMHWFYHLGSIYSPPKKKVVTEAMGSKGSGGQRQPE